MDTWVANLAMCNRDRAARALRTTPSDTCSGPTEDREGGVLWSKACPFTGRAEMENIGAATKEWHYGTEE